MFVFVDKPVMDGAAASTAGLAADTTGVAKQTTAAGAAVVPPGFDEVSAANVARIRAYIADAYAKLGADAGFQGLRGTSIAVSAAAYQLTDGLNATGLTP